MFINKRPLLIRVTLDARCISAGRQPGLFQFKSAMRVVAIAALHGPFENFMMERQIKLVFDFGVTVHAQLWLTRFQ